MHRGSTMIVVETERLKLRHLTLDDALFILRLLNEPSFLRFVGDKGVRSLGEARDYITDGPVASYERHGFGLYLVVLKESSTSIGICGLIKRDTLEDVDIGFAFLPEFWGSGYAVEAATAVRDHARETLGLTRLVAITSLDNDASIRVLEKLGMVFERTMALSEGAPEGRLFALALNDTA